MRNNSQTGVNLHEYQVSSKINHFSLISYLFVFFIQPLNDDGHSGTHMINSNINMADTKSTPLSFKTYYKKWELSPGHLKIAWFTGCDYHKHRCKDLSKTKENRRIMTPTGNQGKAMKTGVRSLSSPTLTFKCKIQNTAYTLKK